MSTKQSSQDTMNGRTLGHYRLLVSLGVGGMGQVWAAHDTSAPGERVVALKTNHSTGAEALRVLWDEARLASLIQHPNVCPVYELAEAEDMSFLVMQWCDGATFHDILEASPGSQVSKPLAARIVANVAAGLQAAHELIGQDGTPLKVVHRDVSPQNILISTNGAVTVTDFGVAKAAGQAHRPTETGEMKGKLSYMAPEQVKSKDIDHRVDIFALGCVLYQATLGHRPFHGGDALATMYKLLEERVVPPSELDPDYPPELEAIVLRALAKDRNERYQTAEELQDALERWLVSTRSLVTNTDIASYLMEVLGPRVRERNERVFKALRNEGVIDEEPLDALPGESGESVSATVSGTAGVVLRERSSRLTRLAGIGAIAALSAVLAVVWFTQRDPQSKAKVANPPTTQAAKPPQVDPPAPTPQESTAPAPNPSPPAARSVDISVAASPSDAEILLDGSVVGIGTFTRSTKPSHEPRELEVRAPNYISQTREIVFDRTRALTISLQRLRQSSAAKPARPTTTELPRASQNPGRGKTPRSLDSDNPFARKE